MKKTQISQLFEKQSWVQLTFSIFQTYRSSDTHWDWRQHCSQTFMTSSWKTLSWCWTTLPLRFQFHLLLFTKMCVIRLYFLTFQYLISSLPISLHKKRLSHRSLVLCSSCYSESVFITIRNSKKYSISIGLMTHPRASRGYNHSCASTKNLVEDLRNRMYSAPSVMCY